MRRNRLAAVLAGLLALPGSVVGAVSTATDAGSDAPRPRREWLPEGSLYAPYLAEINRPGLGVTVVGVSAGDGAGIPEAGDLRFGLKLGGRFGLLRVNPRTEGGRSWQLSLGAGFYGHFDIDNSLDNIGWDGLYSLVLTNGRSPATGGGGPAFRIGVQHWSSHVGDEYAERTGRKRIGYTREEVVVGMSWPLGGAGWSRPGAEGGGWRIYGEGAYGHVGRAESPAGEDLQEPGRVQLGLEHESPGSLGGSLESRGRWGWYAAFDASAYQERDWEPNLTLSLGLLADRGERRWRTGVTLYDGRAPIGEFFRRDETYAILGLWLDLERPPPVR